MQEVFEKIITNLETEVFKSSGNMIRTYAFERTIEIVKQAAKEYNNENYFNLDHTTLHKCPKCGAFAEHRVNRKGAWACGCFECNLFKTSYDHGKAIEEWEDFCIDNNGWIPCSVAMPGEHKQYDITFKNSAGIHSDSAIYNPYLKRWLWDADETELVENEVLAWAEKRTPYQPKGE